MLISKYTEVKWNAKNKKHYVDLGYNYTNMGDVFLAKVEDLTVGSCALIKVKCDYCGNTYELKYDTYAHRHNKNKDCCGNPECTTKKAQECVNEKYGVCNVRELDWVNDKIKNTNIEKYGCENVFSNDDIKSKIASTNLEKYGCKVPTQNEDVKLKLSKSRKQYAQQHPESVKRKELSPCWIGDADYKRSERATFEYNEWRRQVYERDNYTCQCCGMIRTNSSQPSLNAHHILNFAQHKDLRTNVDNGITLCEICHTNFHKKYGKKDNTLEQLTEFISNFR